MLLSLLGRARIGGLDVSSQRQRRLLAALVVHQRTFVSAGRLAAYVWGEDQPNDPVAALHTLVSRLRTSLDQRVIIASSNGEYCLTAPLGALDVDLVIAWRSATESLDSTQRVATLDELLALFRGEPFVDLDDVDVLSVKEQLGEIRLAMLESRAEALSQLGRLEEAIISLRAVVAERPDRESAVLSMMAVLYALGRQVEALAAASTLRAYLLDEFGVDPSPRVAELELAVLRHDVERFEPLSPRTTERLNRAPHRTTSFVGRQPDIDEITALIGRSRLLTVLGPGGMGKTSIVMEVATGALAQNHIVHVVELADIEVGDDLTSAIAGRVGAVQLDSDTLERALIAFLDVPDTVLVLDNCEHVIESVAALAGRLLASAVNLRILATSREPLRISGEHRWVLGPLTPHDAAALFLDRARAIDPRFAAGANDRRVAELCERLDGLPLALELAAASLSGRGLDVALQQLSDRFALLATNHRMAPARHRSLAATLDWSYSRLEPDEQQAFDRLGVFTGSFTADEARELVGEQAAARLPQLVERSLVMLLDTGGTSRYEMLDTMRAYAQLRRGAALNDDRARHSIWILNAATSATANLMGPDEIRWFRWFRDSMSGFRQAHQWFVSHDDHDNRIRLVRALITWAWQHRQSEVMSWAAALSDQVHTDDPDLASTAAALSTIALSRTPHANLSAAQACVDTAATASAPVAALAHYAAAEIGLFVGRYDLAEQQARQSFDLATLEIGTGDHAALTFFAAIDMGFALSYLGHTVEAETWIAEAERWAYRLDSPGAHAWVSQLRAEAYSLSEPLRARVHAQRCLALVDPDEHGFLNEVAKAALVFIGSVLGERPDVDTLCRHLENAERHSSWQDLSTSLCIAAYILGKQGKLREAITVIAAVAGSSIDPVAITQRSHELLEHARLDLGTPEFDEAWARGQRWSVVDAVHVTVSELRAMAP
jgi:predicted ATPase/DNA-binding SARP family transcriptional activator